MRKFLVACLAIIIPLALCGGGMSTQAKVTATNEVMNANATSQNVKFHFLDVNSLPLNGGQIGSADCIIIEDNGIVTVVDAGEVYANSIKKITDYIDALSVKTIDHLFLTHPHSDHGGGMPALIQKYDVKNVYLKGLSDWTTMRQTEIDWRTREIYDDIYLAAKRKLNSDNSIVNIVIPNAEMQKVVINENSFFEIMNCTQVFEDNIPDAEFNDYSMVVKYTHKNVKALLMGDINRSQESAMLGHVANCDILKISHHGTPGSMPNKALFTEVNAKFGIITGIAGNTMIHPEWAPDWTEGDVKIDNVHKAFAHFNITEAITEDGDIIISTDGATCTMTQNQI